MRWLFIPVAFGILAALLAVMWTEDRVDREGPLLAEELLAEKADRLEIDIGIRNREIARLRQQLTDMAYIAEECEVSK